MATMSRMDDDSADVIALTRMSVGIAETGLAALSSALDGALGQAVAQLVDRIEACIGRAEPEVRTGRVVVTGMGKSGHIARKIASTLASTGTPALFVHPAEASHGDLGMIGSDDVVIALSWSGETPELSAIVDYARRFGVFLVALTARQESMLGRTANLVLPLPDIRESCPHNLAPTTSTLLMLALGDALAVTLMQRRGFSAADYREFHPGGKLGAILRQVRDIMHTGDALPLVPIGSTMSDAIIEMTGKGFGCVGVVGADGALAGIITDGDLRRHMTADLLARSVESTMTASPRTITGDQLGSAALALINNTRVTTLFVVDAGNIPVGIVHVHDLLRRGIA